MHDLRFYHCIEKCPTFPHIYGSKLWITRWFGKNPHLSSPFIVCGMVPLPHLEIQNGKLVTPHLIVTENCGTVPHGIPNKA
jgi:hypothetical protein